MPGAVREVCRREQRTGRVPGLHTRQMEDAKTGVRARCMMKRTAIAVASVALLASALVGTDKRIIAEIINAYNHRRLHSALSFLR